MHTITRGGAPHGDNRRRQQEQQGHQPHPPAAACKTEGKSRLESCAGCCKVSWLPRHAAPAAGRRNATRSPAGSRILVARPWRTLELPQAPGRERNRATLDDWPCCGPRCFTSTCKRPYKLAKPHAGPIDTSMACSDAGVLRPQPSPSQASGCHYRALRIHRHHPAPCLAMRQHRAGCRRHCGQGTTGSACMHALRLPSIPVCLCCYKSSALLCSETAAV